MAGTHHAADCSAGASVSEYKRRSRKYIQDDLHYHIVANVGDQQSDLTGGYADQDFKVPNPFYFIP